MEQSPYEDFGHIQASAPEEMEAISELIERIAASKAISDLSYAEGLYGLLEYGPSEAALRPDALLLQLSPCERDEKKGVVRVGFMDIVGVLGHNEYEMDLIHIHPLHVQQGIASMSDENRRTLYVMTLRMRLGELRDRYTWMMRYAVDRSIESGSIFHTITNEIVRRLAFVGHTSLQLKKGKIPW